MLLCFMRPRLLIWLHATTKESCSILCNKHTLIHRRRPFNGIADRRQVVSMQHEPSILYVYHRCELSWIDVAVGSALVLGREYLNASVKMRIIGLQRRFSQTITFKNPQKSSDAANNLYHREKKRRRLLRPWGGPRISQYHVLIIDRTGHANIAVFLLGQCRSPHVQRQQAEQVRFGVIWLDDDNTHQSQAYTHHQTRRRISLSIAGQVPASQWRPISKEIRTAKPIQVQPADFRFISTRTMLVRSAARA